METDRKPSKTLSILSWVLLIGALLMIGLLFASIVWMWFRTVLSPDTSIPQYQGLSLPARYLYILRAGFLNVTWLLALVGVLLVWYRARGRGAPAKRIALAISLIFVHRWLQLTLLFQMMFSNFRE